MAPKADDEKQNRINIASHKIRKARRKIADEYKVIQEASDSMQDYLKWRIEELKDCIQAEAKGILSVAEVVAKEREEEGIPDFVETLAQLRDLAGKLKLK